VEIDVGLDAVGLTYEVEAHIAVHAARQGYNRIWTGSIGDPFQTCALRWAETRTIVPGGMGTAIGVMPIGPRTPADLALSAAVLSRMSGGRFVLGIGAGSTYEPAYRTTWGIQERSSLGITRAYLMTLRSFLSGETVTYHGQGINYDNARLPADAVTTPLYLGVAGPEMARLGGEMADGVYLSWCTPGNVDWVRIRIAEGAERAGRDPADVKLAASVRICVDDDTDVARRALAAALLPYVLGWGGMPPQPFRANFERMGFGPELLEIDRMREQDLPRPQIIEAFPDRMLRALGYFGPAGGAAEAVRRQVSDADIAVVRIVPARPGVDSFLAILDASRPLSREHMA
jgi:alkanesulfonate monooxygenase SsuD/methylene tetrahydromethanopterin reductase-like flavin-dependent oxidoreductase (luciferase family)